MAAGEMTFARASRRRAPRIRWCPACRHLQTGGHPCPRCGTGQTSTLPLVRGLASIDMVETSGLIHYRGERTTTLIGLGLILLIPLAAAMALAANWTGVATALLLASFVGLPALAFIDAHRAGAEHRDGPQEMPVSSPTLPETSDSDGNASGDGLERPSRTRQYSRRPMAVYRGHATISEDLLEAPISEESCLSYRLDIRAGERAALVARYTADNPFLVTCADGSQALIAGVVELVGQRYQTIEAAERSSFTIADTYLLPALFSSGGWACELAIRPDDAIQVQGPLSGERHSPLVGSSYRQAGAIEVLRGTAGCPVVVSLLDDSH